jgi:chaperone modulatory protein CbpM
MTERYSEDEAIAAVALLTRPLLTAFVRAEIIVPVQAEGGVYFRQVDIVRMELLCELHEQFDMNEDALAMVISLIDQLHEVRLELRSVLQAVEAETDDVQQRIAAALMAAR